MSSETNSQDIVDTATTQNTGEASQETQQPVDTGEQVQGDAKPQENKDGGDGNPDPKPKRNRAQERIEQTTRENAELRRKLAEYEDQKNAPKSIDKPKIEEFESYDEYEEKLEEWRVSEAMRRIKDEQSKLAAEDAQIKQHVEYSTAIIELQEDGIDTESLFKKAETLPPLPIQLDQFGLSAKEALKLAVDLLQDDDLYFEISKMNPIQAAARIGRMIDSTQVKSTVPKIPNAPKPIKPTSANAPVKRDTETMSDNEFLKSRGL